MLKRQENPIDPMCTMHGRGGGRIGRDREQDRGIVHSVQLHCVRMYVIHWGYLCRQWERAFGGKARHLQEARKRKKSIIIN